MSVEGKEPGMGCSLQEPVKLNSSIASVVFQHHFKLAVLNETLGGGLPSQDMLANLGLFPNQETVVYSANVSSPNTSATLNHQQPEHVEELNFLTYGVFIPVVCLIGIIGNTLNLATLTGMRQRAIMYIYLYWMAWSDLFAMIAWLPAVVKDGWALGMTNKPFSTYMVYLAYPILNVFLVSSALLVVAITVERYFSICHPLLAKTMMTRERACLIVIFCYTLPVVFYIPMCFEYILTLYCNRSTNRVEYTMDFNPTVKNSIAYQKAYKWLRVIFFKILCIAAVIIMNTLSVVRFRQILKKRVKMKGAKFASNRAGAESRKFLEEYKLMVMLGIVVVTYTVCIMPMAFLDLLYASMDSTNYYFRLFSTIANILEVANSALNFYVYCVGSTDFRDQLRKTVCCCIPLYRNTHENGASPDTGYTIVQQTNSPIETQRTSIPSHGKQDSPENKGVEHVEMEEVVVLNNKRDTERDGELV